MLGGRGGLVLLASLGLLLVLVLLLLLGRKRPSSTKGGGLRLDLGDVSTTCQVISTEPVIRVYDGFLTPEECREIIELYEPQLEPSTVADDKDHTINKPNPNRTSWSAFCKPGKAGDLVERIEKRAVALTGKSLRHMENLQLVRYTPPGQHYAPHFDFFHNDPDSQRTVTCFVYLNDTSGEAPTRFTKLNLEVVPKVGRACVWDNAPTHGKGHLVDHNLEHAGLPVKTATKYGLNIWWRSLPFRPA